MPVHTGTIQEANRWLNRTEWAEHLAGHRWDDIVEWAVRPTVEGDAVLWQMCQSFDRVIAMAQRVFIDRHCPFFIRFQINKKRRDEVPRTPFQARIEKETRK